ncbi:hypothetical protein [Amycolatopsis sp. MEPSY49]|uniref:hypothetical protein n=1 Tax=Amycolatopsis sp. MEPSY49 TaxID=3151600 RepID=UPI003EF1AE59
MDSSASGTPAGWCLGELKQQRYLFDLETVQAMREVNSGDVVLAPDSLVDLCFAAGCPAGRVLLNPFHSPETPFGESACLHAVRCAHGGVIAGDQHEHAGKEQRGQQPCRRPGRAVAVAEQDPARA